MNPKGGQAGLLIWSVGLLFRLEGVINRLARSEVFDLDEMAIGHFYDRTTWWCFLMGDDLIGP